MISLITVLLSMCLIFFTVTKDYSMAVVTAVGVVICLFALIRKGRS